MFSIHARLPRVYARAPLPHVLFVNQITYGHVSLIDISKWNTAKVNTLNSMFWGAEAFNAAISGWDTSSVTRMDRVFAVSRAACLEETGSLSVRAYAESLAPARHAGSRDRRLM